MTVPKKANVDTISLRFAQRLRQLRRKRKLTQEQAAALAGIDLRYYQRLESRTPNAATLVTLYKLAKAFKTSPSKLLDY